MRSEGMLNRTQLFLPLLLILMAWNPSFADHPLITDDAETHGKGKFQIELNSEYGREKENGRKEVQIETATILTYGLLDPIDLVLTVPHLFIKTRESGEKQRDQGMSDIGFEVKWRFYEKEGLGLAIKPGMTLPTGNEKKGLGTGRVTCSFHFIATKEFHPLEFHANLGYIRNENKIDERKDIWHASLAVKAEVVKDLEVVGNIGAERNRDKTSGTSPAFLLGGIIYTIYKNLNLDLGVKTGFNKPETDITFLAGLTYKF
jgi:hypothetical protein